MKRLFTTIIAVAALAGLMPVSAQADFGLKEVDLSFRAADGSPVVQAGAHPFELSATADLEVIEDGKGNEIPDGAMRDLVVQLPPGFAGVPSATQRCSTADFAIVNLETELHLPECPNASVIGYVEVKASILPYKVGEGVAGSAPLYNLQPPPGTVARFGFVYANVPVIFDVKLSEDPPYRVVSLLNRTPQPVLYYGGTVTIWGNPADEAHDPYRGSCWGGIKEGAPQSAGICPVSRQAPPFLILPRSCTGPLEATFSADSWQQPGVFTSKIATTHNDEAPPSPIGLSECGSLSFAPATTAEPTTRAATSPTGLDFALDVNDPNITNPEELAVGASDIKKSVVTLPEGMTINPSQAEGLAVCSEADIARETSTSDFGSGCPAASKIGSVELETPLLPETILKGSLFVAKPYENPTGNLVALYLVINDAGLGIHVVQPLKVEPDPNTGRVTTVAEDMPQVPFSHFRLHFREGARSPLASPPSCGTHTVEATLYPWSGGAPVQSNSTFEIISGPAEGPCPAAGLPPFRPGLVAGTENNAAGAYSPFDVSITRTDSEQEITHFSIKLPPGVAGKLAGVQTCSDAQIAQAVSRTGPHGGQEELDSPSCPGGSQIGRTLAGAGVGSALAYAPGKIYLAGPYNGAPLSFVSITSGVIGPFDIGTVVVRLAIRVNPETGEVFLDSTGSDPIPHIIQGIPVRLRDIRAYTDRPEFTFNPTSCEPMSTAATVLGSGLDFASTADDNPFVSTSRFQAADCASLGYKPRLELKMKGAVKRGGNPALTAILRPRAGDANTKKVSVALPHSEFLDQGHIKTICTRVQFKEGGGNGEKCPAAAVYGHARAWTPLLSDPLEGPIFLRSSEHPLPDLVLALHGLIDFTAVSRIDSVKGGIRNTFEYVPDAPITKVEVSFPGGKKSLLENSTNICLGKHNAKAEYTAHSGKQYVVKVPLKAKCKKAGHKKKHKAKSGKAGGRVPARLSLGW